MTPPQLSARAIVKRPQARTTSTSTPRHRFRYQSKRRTPKPSKPTLLTLPDEPLSQIIALLSTHSPSFQPPPAFYLALTNTRFLRIFRSLLTRITPYTSNPTPYTLSSTHLAAVSRLAGKHLRAIHVPEGALWAELADDCPNVEELCFRDDRCSGNILRYLVDKLHLKVLEVYRPGCETLSVVNIRLEKLVLKEVCVHDVEPLLRILRDPPREIVLDLEDMGEERMESVMNALEKAVPKIENVSVSVPFAMFGLFERDHKGFQRMVKTLRESGQEARCTVVTLSGDLAFRLLAYVDSNASVTLSYGTSLVYRSDAPGVQGYLTGIRLDHGLPAFDDLSHLEELTLGTYMTPESLERIPPLRHLEVDHHSNRLPPVSAEITSLPIPSEPYEEWNFPTRELRFTGTSLLDRHVKGFCETLVEVLERFQGKVIWMDFVTVLNGLEDLKTMRPYVRSAKYACECFQERGGDAGSVLAWLDDFFARCF